MMDPNGSFFDDNTPGWQGQAANNTYTAVYTAGNAPCVYLGKGNSSTTYHTIAPHWGCGANSSTRTLCCRN
jgi:hypothetical protein